MPKKSTKTNQPVPWGFKILAGLEVLSIIIFTLTLFSQPVTNTFLGNDLVGASASTYSVAMIAISAASVVAFFQRNKWGFPLLMFSYTLGNIDLVLLIIKSSANGQNGMLFFALVFLAIGIFLTKYIYDRRWYFNK